MVVVVFVVRDAEVVRAEGDNGWRVLILHDLDRLNLMSMYRTNMLLNRSQLKCPCLS